MLCHDDYSVALPGCTGRMGARLGAVPVLPVGRSRRCPLGAIAGAGAGRPVGRVPCDGAPGGVLACVCFMMPFRLWSVRLHSVAPRARGRWGQAMRAREFVSIAHYEQPRIASERMLALATRR